MHQHHHDHDHAHGHHHDHHGVDRGHNGGEGERRRVRMLLTLVLTLGYMVAEAVGGWWANSLALAADAGHMFSDAGALGLSLFAIWIAQKPPTPEHSYGYYRAEILAALANGASLVVISGIICWEAIARMTSPPAVQGPVMMGIAVGGLLVNAVGLAILHSSRGESLNVQGAWLHLLTDALGSLATIVSGALVWALGWNWADPVASIVIGLLVIYSAWWLLSEAVAILMQRAPRHIQVDQVRSALLALPGVRDIHDLHVWTITGGIDSLSAHVIVSGDPSPRDLLASIRELLHANFQIDHVTIQLEPDDAEECKTSF